MLKPLAPVSLAACALFLPAADLSAQCATFGTPCSHALLCSNSAPPKIGQIWRIGIQAACGNPSNNFMIFGPCASPGLVIPPPLACSSCALQTFPDVFVLPWSWPPRELSVPIPNDVRLVGGTFCVQNICSNGGPCLTFSDPMQVTVLP